MIILESWKRSLNFTMQPLKSFVLILIYELYVHMHSNWTSILENISFYSPEKGRSQRCQKIHCYTYIISLETIMYFTWPLYSYKVTTQIIHLLLVFLRHGLIRFIMVFRILVKIIKIISHLRVSLGAPRCLLYRVFYDNIKPER